MTKIESKTVTVNQADKELYQKLSDFNNFQEIMPESVTKFEADNDSFIFGIKGMPEVRLVLDEKQEPEFIRLKSASSKLDFSLTCHIKAIDDSSSEAYFHFEGDFNPMLKMMVERPLKNFIESLADKLASL